MTTERKITPDLVTLDVAGMATSHYHVNLPEWAVADDLKDPAIWSRVQTTRTPLRVHDSLYIVGFANKFAVEARVVQVSSDAAVLALQKIIHFPERLTPLFSDDQYRVVWSIKGFAVERISDGRRIGNDFGSEGLAIRHIQQQHAQRVHG